MRQWDVAKIFPNHGDPDVIIKGGYDKTLIDATESYGASASSFSASTR